MNNNFKVGDKIKVPKTKSIGDLCIKNSSVLNKTKTNNIDHLFITHICNITGIISCNTDITTCSTNFGMIEKSGDYFTKDDLEHYEEEDCFVLPEEWCLKITEENINFCKSLENNELGFVKDYNYVLNGYYSPIKDKDGYLGSFYNKNRIEITLYEFKKYVLKISYKEESELYRLIRESKELYNL